MATGTVKWFSAEKGYGFITADDGSGDVFAHYRAIDMEGFRSLSQHQKVEYDADEGARGVQAERIRPL